MIKIAYVINYIVKNGPSCVVRNLINNLDKTKYDISLITLFSGNDEEVVEQLRSVGVTVLECKTLNRMGCILFQNQEFTKILEREQYDIIHTHGFIPDILSSRAAGTMKKISTIHNNMYEDYLDSYGFYRSRIYIALHLSALKKLDKCVCCSKSVFDVVNTKLNNTCYIRNGVEPVQAHSVITRQQLNIPNDGRLFLYAGVLSSRKNVVWLVQQFVKYHSANEYLIVLGEGEKESECRAFLDDHIKMLGFQSDPAAYMKISDIYISASKSEGFSISVLEALSAGMGLFLSDIPSHRELIEMQDNTYIGEVFSQDAFCGKMNVLRQHMFQRNEISNFQNENISAKSMTIKYDLAYGDLFTKESLWKKLV